MIPQLMAALAIVFFFFSLSQRFLSKLCMLFDERYKLRLNFDQKQQFPLTLFEPGKSLMQNFFFAHLEDIFNGRSSRWSEQSERLEGYERLNRLAGAAGPKAIK